MDYRKEHYVVDGSLRDVCVLDAGIVDWRNLFAAIKDSLWEVVANFGDAAGGVHAFEEMDAEHLFAMLEGDWDASAALSIKVDGIWFACYFFDISEIEFTFDPADVSSVDEFRSLCRFMTWLGDVCQKRVIMTMETTDHRTIPPLLEYAPLKR